MSTLTYPISPDYVKSWTTDRAIAELIANALDEDPAAQVTWADGTLTITDEGPGIPEEGLILGYSPKDEHSIGQFGEGAKIASLVLARAEEVTRVHVETVGYAFTPTLETHHVLAGIAPRRLETPPQVLVYTFTSATRARGTKVSIDCPESVAQAAIARFRHLTEPGYVPPTSAAQVILSGPAGRLFIGGVLVSTLPRFHASYDFPLEQAKAAQNRDRTVIDADTLAGLVGSALAGNADPDVVTHFAQRALDGRRFSDPEKYFPHVEDPRVKAAFRAVGKNLFADRPVFYSHGYGDEAALALLDGAYELITTSLDQHSHGALMHLLGVELARAAQVTNARRSANKTRYVRLDQLTAAERDTLEGEAARLRGIFGAAAIGKLKVFTETTNDALVCADGFYSPADGSISVLRDVLADPVRTLEVLAHEVAHRRGHQSGREYGDRTRGFEHELTAMLAGALRLVPDEARTVIGDAAAPLASQGPPRVRVALAALIGEKLPDALRAAGVADEGQLSDSLALHRNYLRRLTNPRPAGWRTAPASMSPSIVADFRKLDLLGGALGVTPGVLWLGHVLCDAPGYGRPQGAARGGAWGKRIATSAAAASADLRSRGGVHAAAADQLDRLISGEEDSAGDVEEWTAFALEVIAAEHGADPLP